MLRIGRRTGHGTQGAGWFGHIRVSRIFYCIFAKVLGICGSANPSAHEARVPVFGELQAPVKVSSLGWSSARRICKLAATSCSNGKDMSHPQIYV